MYRDVKEDTLPAAQVRSIIDSRICADVQNQIIKTEVDAVSDEKCEKDKKDDGVASLDYSPTQGAVGKSGKGADKGKGDKGKGYGKDWKGSGWKGSGDKCKGLGAGKGERPVEACSHCWGFGRYHRACPIRLGPEAAEHR